MRKLLLAALIPVGLAASLGFAPPAHAAPERGMVQQADYYWHHHHYRHRHWDQRHHHWDYY